MKKRDLKADLELCNKATPGPWIETDESNLEVFVENTWGEPVLYELWVDGPHVAISRKDMEFMIAAREGWPHAIERAMRAEMLLRDILPMAMWESCMYKGHPDANPCTHCCDWNDFVERIKEVLGDG